MKKLIVAAFLLSTSAFAGSVQGHIHFQSESTWVNAYYSKSLCVDGNVFRASISKCLRWENRDGDRECVRRGKVTATQPMVSTRKMCASYRNDECTSYTTVRYEQSRDVLVKFFNNNDQLVRSEMITVPNCN